MLSSPPTPVPSKQLPRIVLSRKIHSFFLPSLDTRLVRRVLITGLSCYLLFSYVLIPMRIQGHSMEPTYRDGSFAFCWRPSYLFSDIQYSDVVTVRLSGKSTMLLKRVIAVAGDTIEFKEGILYRNDKEVTEPYVKYRMPWNLETRTVATGHVYVVGDNRGTPMSRHRFGQVKRNRIMGGVIP